MDAMYEKLADAIEKSNKTYDIPRIRAAYELAKKAHEGQMRSSGDPYISHPIEVAVILVGLGMDSDTIIGGLLHDVVEDTTVTLEDIEKQFGGDVAELVDGVTKLANIPYSSRAEQQAENVRKMLLAMAKDVRVVIIKLADRLHNMRTLDYRIPEKQRVKSLETMESLCAAGAPAGYPQCQGRAGGSLSETSGSGGLPRDRAAAGPAQRRSGSVPEQYY